MWIAIVRHLRLLALFCYCEYKRQLIMAEKIHFLTSEGRVKLEKELEYLRTTKRLQIAASLQSAVDEGDLSENSGYDESKREQAFVEGRIRDLEAILSSAQLLQRNGNSDVVGLGSHVTVSEQGGDPETYQIVGRTEADPLKGRISNESPLGRALMGCHMGQTVQVNTPGGLADFEIIAVE
jgi:transcription elongation factor GreA